MGYRDDGRHNLEGSKSLDLFRRLHKDGDSKFYSSDLDFVWIRSNPLAIVALLELKNKATDKKYTWTESVMYKIFLTHNFPVYTVDFLIDKKKNIYDVDTAAVLSIDLRKPITWEKSHHLKGATWEEFLEWERFIRNNAPFPDWSKHRGKK